MLSVAFTSLLLASSLVVFSHGNVVSKRQQSCPERLYPCISLFMERYGSNPPQDPDVIIALLTAPNGLETQCNNVRDIKTCFVNAIGSSQCINEEGMREALEKLRSLDGLVQFICVDQLHNIKGNMTCFLTTEVNCNPDDIATCHSHEFVQCVTGAMKQNRQCGPGAEQLLEDLVDEVIAIIPDCNSYPTLKAEFVRGIEKFLQIRIR